MYSTARIFCCYHPDFKIDEESEKGYLILNTGKWVVEWDELDDGETMRILFKTLFRHKHKRKEFQTPEEAEEFMNILHRKQKVFD
jgi:hypothetical protein